MSKQSSRKERNFLSFTDRKKIQIMYLDGYSSTKLQNIFNVSNRTIFNILNEGNIKTRSVKEFSRDFKKYFFNVNFFVEETPKLAYFYGFCLGDGSLSNKRESCLRITINKKDKEILDKFVIWFSGSKDIIKINKNTVSLRLNNSFFKNDLSKWGLVVNKTYNPSIPKINNNILTWFLLGLIDADGSVKFSTKKGYEIRLVCNKLIIDWFIDSIRKIGYYGNIKIYDDPTKVWSRVCITKKQDVVLLSNLLKINECDFILNRKWNSIKNFLKDN